MSEHDEQVALFRWARLAGGRYPELALLHAIPNGGKRDVRVARKLKAEGVRAGVPDICLPVARGGYHGLYVELKHGSNKPTATQQAWLERLTEAGYCAEAVWEFDGARALIERYLGEGL